MVGVVVGSILGTWVGMLLGCLLGTLIDDGVKDGSGVGIIPKSNSSGSRSPNSTTFSSFETKCAVISSSVSCT